MADKGIQTKIRWTRKVCCPAPTQDRPEKRMSLPWHIYMKRTTGEENEDSLKGWSVAKYKQYGYRCRYEMVWNKIEIMCT
jgi:hypothetical protein